MNFPGLSACIFSAAVKFPFHVQRSHDGVLGQPGSCLSRHKAPSEPELWPRCLHPACPSSPCTERGCSSWNRLLSAPKSLLTTQRIEREHGAKHRSNSSVSEAVKNISDKGPGLPFSMEGVMLETGECDSPVCPVMES